MSDIPFRVRTKQCRTAMAVPSDFDIEIAKRSAQSPSFSLQRDFVFGVNSLMSGNALLTICPNVVMYASAAVVVVHDLANNRQIFLDGMTDDITCLALSPCKNFAAAGQIGKGSFVCVWRVDDDSLDLAEELQSANPIAMIGQGFFERAVSAVCFSPDAQYICALGCDDHHNMGIWSLSTCRLEGEAGAANGDPDIIRAIAWSPGQGHNAFVTKEHFGVTDLICTAGARHLKFWSFMRPSKTSPGSLIGRAGRLGKQITTHPKTYNCVAFAAFEQGPSGAGSYDVFVGADDGNVYRYRECVGIACTSVCPGGVTAMDVVGDYLFCGGAKFALTILSSADFRKLQSVTGSISIEKKNQTILRK